MGATPDPEAFLERLPSGRHRLTRQAVVASQRGRLLDAAMQVIADRGYAATSVADIVARAGVSRRTFYEQFPDKEACFLAAYDVGVELVLGRLRDAVDAAPGAGWRERARATVSTFLEVLSVEPAFAFALHIETLAAGPGALKRRAEVFGLVAGLWRGLHERARREDPRLAPLPPDAFLALTGALDELIRECLRTRGAAALTRVTEPALAVVSALLSGRAEPAQPRRPKE